MHHFIGGAAASVWKDVLFQCCHGFFSAVVIALFLRQLPEPEKPDCRPEDEAGAFRHPIDAAGVVHAEKAGFPLAAAPIVGQRTGDGEKAGIGIVFVHLAEGV